MKVWRLYLKQPNNYRHILEFETNNKDEMYTYVVDMLYDNRLTYDPCANYPSKSMQIELFNKHFNQLGWDYISNLLEGYIESKEINLNNNKEDRDSYIKFKLKEHYEEAQSLGYEIFAIILQGSQNYGLDIYTDEYSSDVDTKCIVLPSLDDIILNRQPISTTHERENKEHIDLKDIRTMFETFRKQNVNFVEVLFSDYYIVPDKYQYLWNELRSIAEEIVHAHPAQTLRAMSGMSMEKYKALKHPYPTIKWKIDKWGYDGKQLHHIIRINDFINRYICGMPFKEAMQCTPSIRDTLIRAKLNKYSLKEAEELASKYNDLSKNMKDNYIESMGDNIVKPEAYDKLDNIKAQVLKQYFTEVLLNDDGNE